MQLDSYTIQRGYRELYCVNTEQPEDVLKIRICKDEIVWPHEDVAYKYLMYDFVIEQQSKQNKIILSNIQLDITDCNRDFSSDRKYMEKILFAEIPKPERFMS